MRFEKYHGLGNDFIIVSYEEASERGDLSELARDLCDRKTGIGADGLIVVSEDRGMPEMIFYNADGSYDTMCGNGFRCLCLYLKREGIVREREFSVKTGAGVLRAEVVEDDPFQVRVAMGEARYEDPSIGVGMIDRAVELGGDILRMSAVYVGTPHVVIFVDEIDRSAADEIGTLVNDMPCFPEGTSVNFCRVEDEGVIEIITWERGVGLTMACGTGSCASAVVARELGRVSKERIRVKHALGELVIETGRELYMTGGGVRIAAGTLDQI